MIALHRLAAHAPEPFHLNPDLIQTVEASPDTHILLTTGDRFVVSESPRDVVALVEAWRVGLMADALRLGRA